MIQWTGGLALENFRFPQPWHAARSMPRMSFAAVRSSDLEHRGRNTYLLKEWHICRT